MPIRAVLFDLGGVVLDSPMPAISEYEAEIGAPAGFINRVVGTTGSRGAWALHEQGRLAFDQFVKAFELECSRFGHPIDARELMTRITDAARVRPSMLAAVESLREAGYVVGALTNNWPSFGPTSHDGLSDLFDVFVESAAEGVNKPDPRIYNLALERLDLDAAEVVFLDDLGRNLKTARELGMATIKVDSPEQALDELGRMVSVTLSITRS